MLAAARKLFARRGYTATTIGAIAREAGVSDQLVYKTFGNKAALVLEQVDEADQLAGIGELLQFVGDPSCPPLEQARAVARFQGRLVETQGDLILAARHSLEPELRAYVEEGFARHRQGVMRLMTQWEERGLLAVGMDSTRAAAIVSVICSIDLFSKLKEEHCWQADDCIDWMAQAAVRLVLAETT